MNESNRKSVMFVELKQSMGYVDPENRCKNCSSYIPNDCSGNIGAKSEHCTLNPAVELPVSAGGFCNFFSAKVSKVG